MEKELKTIKSLSIWLASLFAVSFLDGMFELGFSENIYFFLGLGMMLCLILLLRLTFKVNK